jgi:hypothetical protein
MATVSRNEGTLEPKRVSVREMRPVFGAAFALMVLSFADRQVVVATFPQLKDYPTVRLDGPTGTRLRRILGELFHARSGVAASAGGAV